VTARPAVQHLSIIKENDDWETPKSMLLDFCFAHNLNPQLDVCTTKKIAKRLGFPFYFTRKNSAFDHEWTSDFFMNCPYNEKEKWISYAIEQANKHKVTGLILTFSKTDTKWWHKYVEHNPQAEVHNIEGRVKFCINGKPSKNSAPYPSCWIIYRGEKKEPHYIYRSAMPNPEHAIQ